MRRMHGKSLAWTHRNLTLFGLRARRTVCFVVSYPALQDEARRQNGLCLQRVLHVNTFKFAWLCRKSEPLEFPKVLWSWRAASGYPETEVQPLERLQTLSQRMPWLWFWRTVCGYPETEIQPLVKVQTLSHIMPWWWSLRAACDGSSSC